MPCLECAVWFLLRILHPISLHVSSLSRCPSWAFNVGPACRVSTPHIELRSEHEQHARKRGRVRKRSRCKNLRPAIQCALRKHDVALFGNSVQGIVLRKEYFTWIRYYIMFATYTKMFLLSAVYSL